ncbi:MAG: peptidoglycan DD-metalloendopeptidase family protein [Thermoanaerobaculaceae bacterium]|nr:peptidoglycan DD-metalloendopeptidase family protein [Thermoanaerobaculaceae bacterium]
MRSADRLLAGLALLILAFAGWTTPTVGVAPAAPRPHLSVPPLTLPTVVRKAALASGETLAGLVGRLGMTPAELPAWLAAVGGQIDPRALPVGLVAEAVYDVHGAVKALRLTPDWRSTVVVERSGGALVGRREARPVERELVVVRGAVRSSLFDAVATAGEGDTLAVALADLFQWDIDFHREVRSGDTFAILVERIRSDGRTVGYGPVVAASYENRGKRFTAVRYAFDGGGASFYDEMGRPLRKQFLRAPLKFSRLTSRFSLARMHPILGVRLPHWGVDYGAPVGTPVMVTADGVVTYAGWRGGGGKTVEVRHAGGYVTAYLHLSRFAAGVHPGERVAQGEVVGYVGATGLATGPHLDYRITQNGKHLNPLTIGRDPAPPLPRAEEARFAAWARRVLPLLQTPGPLAGERVAALQAAAPAPFHG